MSGEGRRFIPRGANADFAHVCTAIQTTGARPVPWDVESGGVNGGRRIPHCRKAMMDENKNIEQWQKEVDGLHARRNDLQVLHVNANPKTQQKIPSSTLRMSNGLSRTACRQDPYVGNDFASSSIWI